MAKKQFNYSDLSAKELELLKDLYIDQKVKSMSNKDLQDFAIENISLQIKSTIGSDEELEAWGEMEEFFKDEFESTIRNIKLRIGRDNGDHTNLLDEKITFNLEESREDKKIDMWEE